jgi:hypothetical protein
MSKWKIKLAQGDIVGVEMSNTSPISRERQRQLQEVIDRELREDMTWPRRRIKDWEWAEPEVWDSISRKIVA